MWGSKQRYVEMSGNLICGDLSLIQRYVVWLSEQRLCISEQICVEIRADICGDLSRYMGRSEQIYIKI